MSNIFFKTALIFVPLLFNAKVHTPKVVCLQTQYDTHTIEKINRVKLQLGIGKQSNGCEGYGICNISSESNAEMIEVEILSIERNQISMALNTESQKKVKNYFGKNGFVLEESFELSDDSVKKLLGIDFLLIEKGFYEIINGKVTFDTKITKE